MNLNNESAWQNTIRVNCTKTFYYFDSIINKPFDPFKNKFNSTKKMIHFVIEHLPHFRHLIARGLGDLEMLNILKIKEREYLMIQKDIEINCVPTKESK